jgi:dTDP-4-amino-4,6-dideoxygalactose transaminase
MKIPITKPLFGREELRAVQRPIESGWVVQGPYVKRFEEKFSKFTRARYSAATSSCTTALHAAVAALGLKPGDEVIVPAFTWVATPNAVEYMGAKPVFCDIDLGTFNIDPRLIAPLITPRTVGILPVHLFGLSSDMDSILEIAKKHRLWVVEDAACAFGAQYKGRHVGTFGDFGCFSFHPRKAITTGEGGMVTSGREDLDRLIRSLRDHGASKSDLQRHQSNAPHVLPDFEHLGFNYRMTDIQGALGCAQIDKASRILKARTARARRYDRLLQKLPWLTPPSVPKGFVHGYQSYVTLFNPDGTRQRDKLMSYLEAKGVATRPGTHAPVQLGYYSRKYSLRPEMFPQAIHAEKFSLTLPLYPQMTDKDQSYVIQTLQDGYRES